MSNKDWMDTVAIHIANKTSEPKVVYIDDSEIDGNLVASTINANDMYFVDETELVEFNFRLFRRLRSDWKLQDLKRQVADMELRRSL